MSLPSQRIRFKVNTRTRKVGVDVLTSSTARLLKASDVQFEVALYEDDDTDIKTITGLDQITLSVKVRNERTGLAVMEKTVSSANINYLLTDADWETGAADAAHAVFNFTNVESNLTLDSDEVEYYVIIAGLSDDVPAKQVPFGNGSLIIEESGAFTDAPAAIVEAQFYNRAQSDARYLLAADMTGKLDKAGGTMTGLLTLSGAPTTNLHAATKLYVDTEIAASVSDSLPIAGGTLTGLLTLSEAPTVALHAATKAYADTMLPLAGGTMTGLLTLSGAPVNTGHATTKTYVDTADALKLALAGGTMTGALTLSGAPSSALHAATKSYVDTAVADLVASSPEALNTLNELAAALGNDANFSTTITNSIATKLPLAGGTMTGLLTLSGAPSSASHATTKTYVDTADALKLNLSGGTLAGALQFSGTTHAGIRTNNLTSAQVTALGATSNGHLVYDTTLDKFRFREAGSWKDFSSVGGGTTWLRGSAAPDNGDGADGNFYLRESDGSIYTKSSGAWSVIVAARLPLAGGTVTGSIVFDYSLNPCITFGDASNWTIWHDWTTSGDLNLEFNSAAFLKFKQSGEMALLSGGFLTIAGTQVLTAQQAAIADATDAASAISQLNLLLAALRTHGLIAT